MEFNVGLLDLAKQEFLSDFSLLERLRSIEHNDFNRSVRDLKEKWKSPQGHGLGSAGVSLSTKYGMPGFPSGKTHVDDQWTSDSRLSVMPIVDRKHMPFRQFSPSFTKAMQQDHSMIEEKDKTLHFRSMTQKEPSLPGNEELESNEDEQMYNSDDMLEQMTKRKLQILQAEAKGFLTRTQLGRIMQVLWSSEDHLIQLQSAFRGKSTRAAVKDGTFMYENAKNLPSAREGFFAHSELGDSLTWYKQKEYQVIQIQRFVKARVIKVKQKNERMVNKTEPTNFKNSCTRLVRFERVNEVLPYLWTVCERWAPLLSVLSLCIPGLIYRKKLSISTELIFPGSIFFLSSLSTSIMAWTRHAEPPAEAGKTRIRWKCRCGTELWDDFVELKPDAAADLCKSLVDSNNPNNKVSHPDQAVTNSHNEGALRPGDLLTTTSSVGGDIGLSNTSNTNRMQQVSNAQPTTSRNNVISATLSVSEAEAKKKFLLLCHHRGRDTLRLHQLNLDGIENDFQLFNMLRKVYRAQKGRLASLLAVRKIASVNFRKVSERYQKKINLKKKAPC